MEQFDIAFWTIVIEIIGAIGTTASVMFAIYTYRNAQTKSALLEVKKCLWRIPIICKAIDELLSERVFSAVGDSISNEFRKLHENEQSLDEYSALLIDDNKSHNYKAQAIYAGLKHCDEVGKIDNLIKEFGDVAQTVSLHLPCIGMALQKLFFYIEEAAKRTISPAVFSKSVSATFGDGTPNTSFDQAITNAKTTNSPELYFRTLSDYFSEISEGSLMQTAHGQRTISLSINMISQTCNILGKLEIQRLNRIRRKEKRLTKKVSEINEKHAVEDAMVVLKKYKNYYKEHCWEKMIEWKARIIENMN